MKIRAFPLGLAAVALFLTAACDEPAESPESRAQREAAYRQACVAGILAQRANEDLDVLSATVAGSDPADPVAVLTRQATMAAAEFARAYKGHADLRAGAYALVDSAINHSPTAADSTRYAQRAAGFSIRFPAEGSVEANVFNSYQSDFSELLADPNHPCNWDFPF